MLRRRGSKQRHHRRRQWERSIALYRTAESYIAQSGGSVLGSTLPPPSEAAWLFRCPVSHLHGLRLCLWWLASVPAGLSQGGKESMICHELLGCRTIAFAAQVKWSYMIPRFAICSTLESRSQALTEHLRPLPPRTQGQGGGRAPGKREP